MGFIKSRWVIGLVIVLLGVTLLLNNLNITNINISSIISAYWPILLMFFGLKFLFNKESKGEVLTGIVIIFIGFIFLGRNLGLFYISFSILWKLIWPLILILAGISFIFGHNNSGKTNFAIMSGIEKKKQQWFFESSSYIAFMGGIDLDLSIAEIPDGESILDLTAVMGGIEIIVPRDVKVICEGSVFLGGLELLDRSAGGIISSTKSVQDGSLINKKIVKIYCRALMGGIDIKSK